MPAQWLNRTTAVQGHVHAPVTGDTQRASAMRRASTPSDARRPTALGVSTPPWRCAHTRRGWCGGTDLAGRTRNQTRRRLRHGCSALLEAVICAQRTDLAAECNGSPPRAPIRRRTPRGQPVPHPRARHVHPAVPTRPPSQSHPGARGRGGVRRARDHHQGHQPAESSTRSRCRSVVHQVGAHDQEEVRGAGRPGAASARRPRHGVDGVARAAAVDLDPAGLDPGQSATPRPRPWPPVLGAGDRPLRRLLPRVVGHHQQHPVEGEGVAARDRGAPGGRRGAGRRCRPAGPSRSGRRKRP